MKKNIAALSVLLIIGITATSQKIDSVLARYAAEFNQERTYLHYDKSSYVPGETIWYKAYMMEGILPAYGSKTFYIDWTDDNGKLLSHTTSPIQGASTNGQFDIPADYKGKYIHIKAYTKWMLNFDAAFLYEKDIRILSANTGTATNAAALTPMLSFFPEGGDAIEGVSNKIAFKANDQLGKPVKIKGIIKNNQGKIVDSLRTLHDGMGYFFLFPKPGDSFTAIWKDEKGVEYNTPLPKAKSSGVAMQIMLAGTRRNFVINADQEAAATLGKVHILGTMNQYKIFSVTKDLSAGMAQGIIPTQDLPSGILTITVFDENWNPLAERITFINNDDYRFTAEMNVLHWGLNKRARNEIEISLPDSLYATLSVSVTDVEIDKDTSNTIISNFLLTSDLKGQVYNPSYYFSTYNEKTAMDLDLVMLTHGWRRFKWDDVVKGKMPAMVHPKDTAYLSLSGKVYGVTPTQLRDKPHIILVISQKNGVAEGNKFLFLPVDPDGTFGDPGVIFLDTANIYYQLSKGIKDATVKFMESKLPAYKTRVLANGSFYNQVGDTTGYARHFRLSDEMSKLLQLYEGKLLENVTLKTKSKSPVQVMDEKYTSGLFGGGDGYQFDLVNDNFAATAQNIFNYLQGKVAGLNISGGQPPSLQWRGGTPLLFLDEVPADINFLSGVNVSDVAYIKVFRPPFFGASGGSGGAIAVYTRRGGDAINVPGKGLSNNSVSGYSPIREFYSPNYSSYNAANEAKDLRTTIYWNPQVNMTPQTNKTTLTFYNNDITKAFRVIIEGMSKDGQLIHFEQIME